MSLSNLIRGKFEPVRFATATPAIFATLEGEKRRTVAGVATVAVAKPKEPETITAFRWLLHFTDRDPLEVTSIPEATHAEILAEYPDAIAAVPFEPTIRQPYAPMTGDEEKAIRAWLALIEETDHATIADVLNKCKQNADARDYFTGRAADELPKPDPFLDDRRRCSQCLNLRGKFCTIAIPGGLVSARRGYEPMRNTLQRCAGYLPGADDLDKRPGGERWPGLIQREGE